MIVVSYITLALLWCRDGTAAVELGRWRLLSRTRKQVKRQPIMMWKMDRKKRRWWWKWKLTRRAYHWRGPSEEGRSGNVSFLHLFILLLLIHFCFLNLNMEMMMMTEKERVCVCVREKERNWKVREKGLSIFLPLLH